VPVAVEVRPTIDRRWLERNAALDPIAHAYALWDLDREPEAVRVTSVVRGEETLGYLLVWSGRRDRPVVHAYGSPELADALLEHLPAPPFAAVVPEALAPAFARTFPAAESAGVRMMFRPRARPEGGGRAGRRLGADDRGALAALLARQDAPELAGYAGVDLAVELVWGAHVDGRLAGVARAAVRLPSVWLVGGVYVDPAYRRRGLGAALVRAVVDEAGHRGSPAGLFVRDGETAANRLYERLGFREVGRRRSLAVGPTPVR
jgi:ribosomal protein S18 acetylase RimI-like enzyme